MFDFCVLEGSATMPVTVDVQAPVPAGAEQILSSEALRFIGALHEQFGARRAEVLNRRDARAQELAGGAALGFLAETESVRSGDWAVAPAPADLNDRRVEITGPVDRKMMINALNSGAKVFMADLEDATSPTWANVIEGQQNISDAIRRTITFQNPDGRTYQLNDTIATLVIRPRGWHLPERHILVDGQPASASLVDFGLCFFHNAKELLARGSGPYFYLPKLQSHLEARLWNDVFTFAQQELNIPVGTIRATVLIETIHAAFEMEEILYELRQHAAGLNAGRWDYIFSLIKTLRNDATKVLPDRAQVTMGVPFMRAYTELLVRTCHKRGAHAIGGMAAFIPSRRDAQVNEVAFAKVREDKEREAGAGFDGTWVAHPDLIPIAREAFDRHLGDAPNQKQRLREEVSVTADQLLATAIEGGQVTDAGVRSNVSVAIQYIDNWLRGTGAAAIYNLMEDAATAEISRAQLWQWRHHGVKTAEGDLIDAAYYERIRDEELEKIGGRSKGRQGEAADILDQLVLSETFTDFLTLPAYELLD
jgi:malate synthase